MDTDRRLDAVVRGRVQGVYFRQSTLRQAQVLGLSGWVANRSDGSVAVVAEGPQPILERLLAWLHTGPTMAYVDGVDVAWSNATGAYRGFTVR